MLSKVRISALAAAISLSLSCASPDLSDIDWNQSFVGTRCPMSIQQESYIEEEYSSLYLQTLSLFVVCIVVYACSDGVEVCPMIVFNIDR